MIGLRGRNLDQRTANQRGLPARTATMIDTSSPVSLDQVTAYTLRYFQNIAIGEGG
ncbi:MAG: hypothetical protein R2839_02175 [Thermomicrobiales bacterium]